MANFQDFERGSGSSDHPLQFVDRIEGTVLEVDISQSEWICGLGEDIQKRSIARDDVQLLDPTWRPFFDRWTGFFQGTTPPVLDLDAAKSGEDLKKLPKPLQVHIRHALKRQLLQPLPEREIRRLVSGRHYVHNVPSDESEVLDVPKWSERISIRVRRPEQLRLSDPTFLAEREMLDEFVGIVYERSGHLPAPGLGISRWNRNGREEVTLRSVHPLSTDQRTAKEILPSIGRSNGVDDGVDEFLR